MLLDASRLLEEMYPLLPLAFFADVIMFHLYLAISRRREKRTAG